MTYDLNEAQEEQPSLSLEEMEKMWGAETDLLQRKVRIKMCATQNCKICKGCTANTLLALLALSSR